MKTPILDEIRKTREQLLEESGGTLDGLVRRLQAEERSSSGRILAPTTNDSKSRDAFDKRQEDFPAL